jgi:hypothetical protein
MTFADGAKTQDKATAACRGAGLIGVGNNAGIEECCGFELIIMQKISANQLALHATEVRVAGKCVFHFICTGLECFEQISVPATKILKYVRQ